MRIFSSIYENFSTGVGVPTPLLEAYSIDNGGNILAIMESYQDHIDIVNNIQELSMLENSNSFKDKLKNIWDRMIETLKKLWEKIKSFFQSSAKVSKQMEEKNKTFYEHAKVSLEKFNIQNVTYNMYAYSIEENINFDYCDSMKAELDELYDKAFDLYNSKESSEKLKLKTKDILNNDQIKEKLSIHMQKLSKHSGYLEKEQFTNAMTRLFRSGDEEPREISISVKKIFSSLKEDNFNKITIESLKRMNSIFDNITAGLLNVRSNYNDKLKNDAIDNNDTVKINTFRQLVRYCIDITWILSQYYRCYYSAVLERQRIYTSAISSAINQSS